MTTPNSKQPPQNPLRFLEYEIRYNAWGKQHPDLIHSASPDSVQAGSLRPFAGNASRQANQEITPPPPPKHMMEVINDLQKGIRESWEGIESYYNHWEPSIFETMPGLWEELIEFVRYNWADVRIGFTELPSKMIFRGQHTLFRYALVASQEMNKEKMDRAPDLQAGQEVMRVYASLGLVVNEIASWLRANGVRCQSNHPMGGLVNTPSLAGKAGMGWQGRHGLLITPEFGPRVRLAPVFIEHRYFDFTDNRNNDWIEEYCVICDRCSQNCPSLAINKEKTVNIDGVPGIGALRTCIDKNRCLETFTKTMGCSICIKVCPFSEGGDIYERLKAITVA